MNKSSFEAQFKIIQNILIYGNLTPTDANEVKTLVVDVGSSYGKSKEYEYDLNVAVVTVDTKGLESEISNIASVQINSDKSDSIKEPQRVNDLEVRYNLFAFLHTKVIETFHQIYNMRFDEHVHAMELKWTDSVNYTKQNYSIDLRSSLSANNLFTDCGFYTQHRIINFNLDEYMISANNYTYIMDKFAIPEQFHTAKTIYIAMRVANGMAIESYTSNIAFNDNRNHDVVIVNDTKVVNIQTALEDRISYIPLNLNESYAGIKQINLKIRGELVNNIKFSILYNSSVEYEDNRFMRIKHKNEAIVCLNKAINVNNTSIKFAFESYVRIAYAAANVQLIYH